MAVFTDAPDFILGLPRVQANQSNFGNLAITTYYYRTSSGTRASTTSLASIPVGAVIERTYTG
jgi:hypothetical protein